MAIGTTKAMNLGTLGNLSDVLVLSNETVAAVQITPEVGIVGLFQGTLQGSIDGAVWQDTGKTGLVFGISATEDVTKYRMLRVYVATATGAACTATVSILAKAA